VGLQAQSAASPYIGLWNRVAGFDPAELDGASVDASTWDALETEARALVAFLAPRQPDVYRRYARWWTGPPAADVRIIG